MSAQNSYSINTAFRYHGNLYDVQNSEVISKLAEGGIVPAGVVVGRGTSEDQATVGNTGVVLGITIADLSREGTISTDVIEYADEDEMSILSTGWISITCPTGCTAGDAVKFVDATGVLDAGAAIAGETVLANATWEKTVAAGEVSVIRLNSAKY